MVIIQIIYNTSTDNSSSTLTHSCQVTPYSNIESVNIGSGDGSLSGGTKPSTEPFWPIISEVQRQTHEDSL